MYDKPNRIKYAFAVADLNGDGVEHYPFQGPKGKKGAIWDYGTEGVVVAIDGTTCNMSVGIAAGDVDAYGDEFLMATAVDTSRSVRSVNDERTAAGQAAIALLILGDIPADTEAALVLAEGDASTGAFTAFVIVDWSD